MKYVKEAGLISRFKGEDILDTAEARSRPARQRHQLHALEGLPSSTHGRAAHRRHRAKTTGFLLPLPLLSSIDDALRVTVPIIEGKLYRLGELKIEGNSIFSEEEIRAIIGLQPGDIANGQRLDKALFEDLKKVYGRFGFIQYEYDEERRTSRTTRRTPNEGVADFTITITEGKQFTLAPSRVSGQHALRATTCCAASSPSTRATSYDQGSGRVLGAAPQPTRLLRPD